MNYKRIHDAIIDRARDRVYDSRIHHNHHIIPIHEDPSSSEMVPLTIKEHYIVHYLRWKFVKTIGNLRAYLLIKGVPEDWNYICSLAGKIGGKNTRTLGKGIFSPDYDRGAQSKKNWENGLLDHLDFSIITSIGGLTARDNQVGIHDPKYRHLRAIWARCGAAALTKSGNRSGTFSEEWRKNNPDVFKEIASKGGSIGGKTTGSMKWWNNGIINKRSHDSPGDGWVHGMLQSEKKQKSNLANMKKRHEIQRRKDERITG